VFENSPDDGRVLDAADDPHFPLTLWAEQGIDLVNLLNQARPVPLDGLFIPLRIEDARDILIRSRLFPFSPRDIAIKTVVFDHLLALVGDVGAHGGQPFHRRKNLCGLPVFGRIDNLSLLIQIVHALLGERGPDDVARQVLHSRIIIGRYAVSAEDVEAGMPPCGEHGEHLLCDLSLGEQHPEHLVPEDGLQLFQFKRRGDAEHAPAAVEAAVGDQDVAVGIEAEEIAESLDGDDGAGDGIGFRNCLLEKYLQGFPGAPAQIGKELPVIQEASAQDLRNAENKMPVGDLLEDIHAEPFAELHHALLMAGWAEMTALAGEGQQVFVAAVNTFDTGETIVRVAAVEVAVYDLLDIGPPESVLP